MREWNRWSGHWKLALSKHNSRHRHQDKGNKCRTQEHLLDIRAVTTTHAAIYENNRAARTTRILLTTRLFYPTAQWLYFSSCSNLEYCRMKLDSNERENILWITNCRLQTWAILFNCAISAYNAEWTSKNSDFLLIFLFLPSFVFCCTCPQKIQCKSKKCGKDNFDDCIMTSSSFHEKRKIFDPRARWRKMVRDFLWHWRSFW